MELTLQKELNKHDGIYVLSDEKIGKSWEISIRKRYSLILIRLSRDVSEQEALKFQKRAFQKLEEYARSQNGDVIVFEPEKHDINWEEQG